MSTRIADGRWYIDGNSLNAAYMNWCVEISPNYEEAETLYYDIKFWEGSGHTDILELHKIDSLEHALDIVYDFIHITKFEDLKREVENLKDDWRHQ